MQAACRFSGFPCASPSGEPVVVDGLIPCERVGWLFEFQPPTSARRVVSTEGLDRLAELAGVQTVFVNRSPGDPVDWREGGGHFIYSVAGVSGTTTNSRDQPLPS